MQTPRGVTPLLVYSCYLYIYIMYINLIDLQQNPSHSVFYFNLMACDGTYSG